LAVAFPWYIGPSDQQSYVEYRKAQQEPPESYEGQRKLLETIVTLIRRNPAFLMHDMLWIRNKEGGRSRFNNWTFAQKRLYRIIRQQQANAKPVRAIILKGRQMGVSTECEGLLFWRTAFFRDATSMIVAHEEDAVENIFRMFRLYYESLPQALQPATEKFNQTEIVFDNPNVKGRKKEPGLGSRLIVKTAALGGTSKRMAGKGRSGTYHAVHASEAAFWSEPERFWGGIQNAVPKEPGSFVLVESTANGHGNWFHKFWREAARGWEMVRGESGKLEWVMTDPRASNSSYLPIFLSWMEHPKYRAEIHNGDDPAEHAYYMKHLDSEEKKLVDRFGAEAEQLEWRRQVLADECAGSLKLFHQEYPTTPDEAFITSGRVVFDLQALDRSEDRILKLKQPRRCFIEWDGEQAILTDSPDGPVKVFHPPEPGVAYSIGVDASYGKPNGDFSCAQVIRNDTWEQVAILHGRIEPDLLAHDANALGRYYNEAMMVVEIEGPGIHTDVKLGDLDYWNRYRRINIEQVSSAPQAVWGWRMSQKTRANMVATLKAGVRSGELILNDPQTVTEMREWVLVTGHTGRAKEQPADPSHGHDDRITALGIALVGGVIENGHGGALVSKTENNGGRKEKNPFRSRPIFSDWSEGSHDVLGSMF